MPILSYNCLIKLNLCPMHFFRFQRTWFYPTDQGHPRPGYQTMSTIKGTLRHSRRRGRKRDSDGGKKGEFKGLNQSFNNPARKRKMNKIREPRWRNLSHILEIIQNITQSLKKDMPKHVHIRYHSFPQNPAHLTILEGNAQAKLLGLEFQIPQVLWKSTKFVRIGARIFVVDSFS